MDLTQIINYGYRFCKEILYLKFIKEMLFLRK